LPQDDRLLIDGGAVSNLPIEPALQQGATEIVALDLTEPRPVGPSARGLGLFLNHLIMTVEMRQIHVETQLAAARGVPVHRVRLLPESPVAVWEFPRAAMLFEPGYRLMKHYLAEHPELNWSRQSQKSWWQRWWSR
jgi:NTE family protein